MSKKNTGAQSPIQSTDEEYENLRFQFGTSSAHGGFMVSQNATPSRKHLGDSQSNGGG
jgi:hypothetical protein